MNNMIGSSSLGQQTWEYPFAKPPKYTVTFTGTQTDCNSSGSVYYAKGWDVHYKNPAANNSPFWIMDATLNQELSGDGITPITGAGSFPTINFDIQATSTGKEILHCNTNIIPWINEITTKDKATLENIIANPPTNTGSFGYSANPTDQGINWNSTDPTSYFYGSTTSSIAAAQVVWTMTNNGFKEVPITEITLRMNAVVSKDYNLSTFYTNINRIYSLGTMATEIGLPSNRNSVLSSIVSSYSDVNYISPSGATIPCLVGFLKQWPTDTQNGATITLQQDWVLGIYYQNVYGTRL